MSWNHYVTGSSLFFSDYDLGRKVKTQQSEIVDFEETKNKFEQSIQELRDKLKSEAERNSELNDAKDVLSRETETMKKKLDQMEKEQEKLQEDKDKRKQVRN
jgi:hypothetical protein